MKKPSEIVNEMLQLDSFSKWLGMEILEIKPGTCTVQLIVNESMLNGFSIGHGGITYSLADSALAFAANAHGYHALSIDTSINHLMVVQNGDILTAHAEEINRSKRNGIYTVTIRNQKKEKVAFFKGLVSIKDIVW